MSNVLSEAESMLEDTFTLLKSRTALAFAEIKDRARRDLAKSKADADGYHRELVKITADADNYRRERDAKTAELHSTQRELQSIRADAESLREKAERNELALKRQREFTETAREDVQQWKDQVTRQQEAHSQDQAESLQEVQDWKDRFRRAEKERLRTAAKLEEIMSASHRRTPNHSRPRSEQSTSAYSSRTKAAAAVYRYDDDLSPTAVSEDEHQRSHKRRRKQSVERPRTEPRKVSARHDHHARNPRTPDAEASEEEASADMHSDLPPRKYVKKAASVRPAELVRRVHAFISVPVKEEDDDEQYALGVESAGLFDTGGTPPHTDNAPIDATRHHSKSAPARTRSGRVVRKAPPPIHSGRPSMPAYVEDDDEEDGQAPAESSDEDNTRDQDYDDDQQAHERRKRHKSQSRRSRSRTRKQHVEPEAREDDPLLLRSMSEEEDVQRAPRTKRVSRSRPVSKPRR